MEISHLAVLRSERATLIDNRISILKKMFASSSSFALSFSMFIYLLASSILSYSSIIVLCLARLQSAHQFFLSS